MKQETMNEAVAIVVGRQNSKGLPQKNIRTFLGKPLVEWSILQALKSRLVSKVIVTSDDPSVLEVASGHGVEIVSRPAGLALDDSPIGEALIHAIEEKIKLAKDIKVKVS